MDVHARDVAAALAAEEGVAGQPGCFSWTSQLRHYFEEQRPADEGEREGGAGGVYWIGGLLRLLCQSEACCLQRKL
jgi:hypothetical protein